MTTGEWLKSDAYKDMMAYRKEHFAVKIDSPAHISVEGGIVISVTFNGHQWTPLEFTPEEFKFLFAKMQSYGIRHDL